MGFELRVLLVGILNIIVIFLRNNNNNNRKLRLYPMGTICEPKKVDGKILKYTYGIIKYTGLYEKGVYFATFLNFL